MKFLVLLFSIFFSLGVAAQRSIDGDLIDGVATYRNYVKNPSARKNAAFVSTSNATATRDTDSGDAIDGGASWLCDASAQNGYCEWTLNTIQAPDTSGNCKASLEYKGDATLYKLQILDGSSNVLHSTLALTNATDYTGAFVNYPCGSSRKVRLTQTESGTGAAVNVGRVSYGKADNVGTVAQAQAAARLYRASSGQTISSTSETVVQFNTNEYTKDGTSDVSSGYKWTAGSSGDYQLSATIGLTGSTLTANERYLVSIRINGTAVCFGSVIGTSSSSVHYMNARCTKPMSAGDFADVTVTSAADTSYDVAFGQGAVFFQVEKFPSGSQIVATSMQTSWGTAKSAATTSCAWSTTSGTMASFGVDADCPSMSVTGNAASPGTKIPGFSVSGLPPGTYQVTAYGYFSAEGSTSGASQCYWEIYDGTSSGGSGRTAELENLGGGNSTAILGTFTYSAAQSSKTFEIRAQRGTGNGSCAIGANSNDLTFSIFPISISIPVPLYVGSVEGSSTVKNEGASGVTTVAAGTYTPTVNGVSNISSISSDRCSYLRVGSVVSVACRVPITCTSASATSSEFNMSLPVASNFTDNFDLRGLIGGSSSGVNENGVVGADAVNDRAQVFFGCNISGSLGRSLKFQYVVK